MADTKKYPATKMTRLSASAAAGATSITVAAIQDRESNTLTLTDFGDKVFGCIDPGGSLEEHFTASGISSTTLSGVKTVIMRDPYTETSGLARAHAAGVKVVLYSNTPAFYATFLNKNNDELVTGVITLTSTAKATYDANPTFSDDKELITKKYADDLAIAGAPDGAEAVKGIYEAATQTEVDEGDDAGTTTAPTVVRPSKVANVVQRGAWVEFTETASGDDAYTATTTPSFTPEEGTIVNGTFATANTGACTFDLNGAGAAAIKVYTTGAIADPETGDIIASQPVVLRKTGSNWVLLSPKGTIPTTALLTEAGTFFTNTDITGAEAEDLTDGGTTSLHTHGSQIVTITASQGFVGSTAGLNADIAGEGGVYMGFDDGADDTGYFPCPVPKGSTSIVSIHVIYQPEATGNLYLKFTAAKALGAGGSFVSDVTDSLTTYPATSSATTHALITVPATAYDAISSVTGGDIVALSIERDASNAADTYTSGWKVMGVKFTFA